MRQRGEKFIVVRSRPQSVGSACVGGGVLAGVIELYLEFGDVAGLLFLLQLVGGVELVQRPPLLALLEEVFLHLRQKTRTR